MGQPSSASVCTPLQCFLKNFQDFKKRAGDYGYDGNAFDLQKFCEREWPTFQVGWPDVGTCDLTTAYRVHHVIYGRPGHSDQIPYIQVWVDILAEKPRWLKSCQRYVDSLAQINSQKFKKKKKSCQNKKKKLGQRQTVLLASAQKGKTPPVLQGPGAEALPGVRPPPYVLPALDPGESRPQAQATPPTLDPEPLPPPMPPAGGALLSSNPFSPSHNRQGTEYGAFGGVGPAAPAPLLPLRQAGPPDLGLDGQAFMIYVPFSTSDLYNWKNQNPSFSQNTQGLISLLESVFFTHQPTWDDCQQLWQTLFTSEERESRRKGGDLCWVRMGSLPLTKTD
uniref:Uncharacterized protein n=1 Tax=Myotis myotis TaxID=51298 RepID=A0A7J7Z3Y5_MYOMY|nr:hypothetical protein mMyoMyo1_010386 [Myotis myotis]